MAKLMTPGFNDRLKRITEDESTMDVICTHVAQGGSLLDLCETWDVVYGRVMSWVNADDSKKALYHQALEDRNEWAKETILSQLRQIANADIRSIFNDDGSLKPISEWNNDIAKAVAGIDVSEDFEGNQKVGFTKKIKMNDKLKAVEMLGKYYSMFVERTHHTGELTLADLVALSNKPKAEEKK